ncbi:MAG: hypothetical protein ACKVE4_11550, partial [Dissulfuribacterales bacterium]
MSLFNKKIPDLPEIPEEEQNPLLKNVLEICSFQKEQLLLQNEIIQGLVIKPHNIRFRLQRWQTPSGEYI